MACPVHVVDLAAPEPVAATALLEAATQTGFLYLENPARRCCPPPPLDGCPMGGIAPFLALCDGVGDTLVWAAAMPPPDDAAGGGGAVAPLKVAGRKMVHQGRTTCVAVVRRASGPG